MPAHVFFERPLKGIIPPLVTPLLSNRTLDVKGAGRLIEHVLSGGVHGLFILGTTGEAASLSNRIKRELISFTCATVNGRVPVLVGISDTSIEESILLAKAAQQAGASALVAAPPFYFKADQRELTGHFNHLADNVTLPLFLYNIPSLTKINIEPSSVKALARHDRIVGLKDSSGDGGYFSAVMAAMRPDSRFSIFVGPDEMMASLVVVGAHGGVSAGANLFPKLYVDLYNASVSRNFEELSRLQGKVMEISTHIYHAVPATAGYLKGIKTALSLMGICDDHMAYPLSPLADNEKEVISKNLAAFTR